MTKYKLVLVSFPFDDLSSSKMRPAVCLTNPIGPYRHIVLAFITSRLPETLQPTDIIINADDEDFQHTGLRVSSVLRLHRVMTVAGSLIQRELGALSTGQQHQVREKLRILFDLNQP